MKYEAVLFDLDGTLIDTVKDLGAAVNHSLSLRGLPLHSISEYTRMVGHGIRDLVTKALPEGRRTPEFVESALRDFRDYYSSHIDVFSRPYAGIAELLKVLHDAGIYIAVASNKFQEGTEALIKRFFPDVRFVSILGNREGFPLKPDPAITEEVLARILEDRGNEVSEGNIASLKKRCVMVGDSGTDIKTALNGGIHSIAVTWGFRPKEELTDADFIAITVNELKELLLAQ